MINLPLTPEDTVKREVDTLEKVAEAGVDAAEQLSEAGFALLQRNLDEMAGFLDAVQRAQNPNDFGLMRVKLFEAQSELMASYFRSVMDITTVAQNNMVKAVADRTPAFQIPMAGFVAMEEFQQQAKDWMERLKGQTAPISARKSKVGF